MIKSTTNNIQGAFGEVFLAIDWQKKAAFEERKKATVSIKAKAKLEEPRGMVVAVKQIKMGVFVDGVNWTALREIKLLREVQVWCTRVLHIPVVYCRIVNVNSS